MRTKYLAQTKEMRERFRERETSPLRQYLYPASSELLPRNCTCTFVTEHYLLLLEQGCWMKRSLVRHVGVDFGGSKDHDQLNASPGIFYSYKGKL
ncbi:hypothetical protein NPIL_931 [Nephila pilipes]|uniref:Uncharacterized protein n=1 Tax=Nephila pilipes TaxID=299642 RepID=A0A8X6Q0S9_NEPPI|nr:hypothetical protein NPIL_931 [Nephila pilipes]